MSEEVGEQQADEKRARWQEIEYEGCKLFCFTLSIILNKFMLCVVLTYYLLDLFPPMLCYG